MKKTMILAACMAVALSVQAGSVKQDGIVLKVGAKSWGKNNGSYNEAAHGMKFFFVEVEISNRRDESVYVNPAKFQLIDRDGYTYGFSALSDRDRLQSATLQPGNKAKGRLAFEIPFNARPRELIFEIGYKEQIAVRL